MASARLQLIAFLALVSSAAAAQSPVEEPIPWAYGAYFGTGVYRISGGEEAFIVSVRPRWQLREAELDAQEQQFDAQQRQWGDERSAYQQEIQQLLAHLRAAPAAAA